MIAAAAAAAASDAAVWLMMQSVVVQPCTGASVTWWLCPRVNLLR
jgi:hypothetical protein